MTDWHIGQNLVCIANIAHDPRRRPDHFPIQGAVYTIRGIRPNPDLASGSPVGFLLEEIVNPSRRYRDGTGEIHFGSDVFRPLKRTDISCFRTLLVNESVG